MRVFRTIILGFLFSLVVPTIVLAAASSGRCLQHPADLIGKFVQINLVCTGSSSDGTVLDTVISAANMAAIKGTHYLYLVRAYPTAGGTAPDAADVFVLDTVGEDYLGSADAGATANKGANLIHATLPKSTIPYSYFMGASYYFPITSNLTVRVKNQGTVNANFTVELTFTQEENR